MNARDVCLITVTLMSNILPPLLIPAADGENTNSISRVSLPPLSAWSDGYRAFSFPSFSPKTLFSMEHHVNTHGPAIASEHSHYSLGDHLSSTFDRNNPLHLPVKASTTSYALPSFQSRFANEASFPLTSPHDASSLYDGTSTNFHEDRSYSPSDVVSRHSNVFYDSEEEGQDEGSGFGFEVDARATFFRTSAERGQWRHDLIPYGRSQMRKSIPTWSPPTLSGLQLVSRPISEPAPSISSPLDTSALPDDQHEDASELPFTFSMSSDNRNMMRQSLPSLMSDRDTSPEQEMQPSSPLPPSSPPLSHMSYPHSPMARSISPLSFAPSSPPPVSSSPLTFSSSVDSDEIIDLDDEAGKLVDHTPTTGLEPTATRASETDQELIYPPIYCDPDTGVLPMSPCATVSSTSSRLISDVSVVTTEIEPISVFLEETSNPPQVHAESQDAPLAGFSVSPIDGPSNITNCEKNLPLETVAEVTDSAMKTNVPCEEEALAEHDHVNPSTSVTSDTDIDIRSDKTQGATRAANDLHTTLHDQERDDVLILDASTNEGFNDVKADLMKKKRKNQMEDSLHDGPPRKKARVRIGEKTRTNFKQEGKRRSEDEEPDIAGSVAPVKKQKKSDRDTGSGTRARQASDSRSDASSNLSKISHEPPSSKPQQDDTDTSELDAEITGMLIECMATSRASSLPISSLYKSLMECRPSLKAQRNEKEWAIVFRRVLKNGVAGTGVFGKVESSGKDDSDRPLEAQWFYVPERDDDEERAALIRSMMPRPSKRTETKKYKQYYYRPLEKISRWDDEDDI